MKSHTAQQQGGLNQCTSKVPRHFRKQQQQCRSRSIGCPVLPASQEQGLQEQQQSHSSTSPVVQLVEIHDRQTTTYSWQAGTAGESTSSGNGLLKVQHQRHQEQQEGWQLMTSLPGRQQLLDALKALYLPAGYPSSVTGGGTHGLCCAIYVRACSLALVFNCWAYLCSVKLHYA